MKKFGERQKFLKQKHRRKNFIYADEILNELQFRNQFLSSFVHGEYVFKIFIKSQSYKLRKQGELFCCSFSLYYLQKPIDFASSPKVDFNAYMNSKARTSCLQFQGLARLFLALLLICSFFWGLDTISSETLWFDLVMLVYRQYQSPNSIKWLDGKRFCVYSWMLWNSRLKRETSTSQQTKHYDVLVSETTVSSPTLYN